MAAFQNASRLVSLKRAFGYCQALRRLVADGNAGQERIQPTTVGTILQRLHDCLPQPLPLTLDLYQRYQRAHQAGPAD